MLEKQCHICNQILDISLFHKAGKNTRRKECKNCCNIKRKLNYTKDNRTYITVTCIDCNQSRKVRTDNKSATKTLCGSCSAKRRKGTQNGLSKHPAYKHWKSMHERCNGGGHPKHEKYYVNKGIKVCEEWFNLETFIKWFDTKDYQKGLELDRIDNNKGYLPDNCRFVTRKQNVRNSSVTVKVIRSDGKQYETITDAANELSLRPQAIHNAMKANRPTKGFYFSRCD